MKKINQVNIMGRIVKVKYVKMNDLGGFNGDKNLITIQKDLLNHPEMLKATLLHECTHAVFFYSGYNHLLNSINSEFEEAIVRCIEYNLFDIILDIG